MSGPASRGRISPTCCRASHVRRWSAPAAKTACATVAAHRAMAARIPGARLVVLDRCGHMVAMERPDDVTAALREWLSR
ncbi:MAG: hypothetical protein WDM81_08775 [Rhizomicrobium sp.]